MRTGPAIVGAFVACLIGGSVALGVGPPATQPFLLLDGPVVPQRLAIAEPESVYPEINAHPEELTNEGAVNFDLNVSFLSRYVFRGVDQSTARPGENALQFDGAAQLDLGKLPHPFVGLFANIFDNDPVTRFEEVRPTFGLHWNLRPLIVEGGYTSYIFPSREKFRDTQEIFARLSIDDSLLFNTDHPVLSPYVFAAYDIDRYSGTYLEAGVKHDFVLGETGVTLTPSASVAYVLEDRYFRLPGRSTDSGLQHYELGLQGSYSLNQILHLSRRFGEWELRGYLDYDGGMQDRLRADNRLWGGIGLHFHY